VKMAVPNLRLFRVSFADTDAVGTVKDMTEQNSGLAQMLLLQPNAIIDVVNEKDPSSVEVEIQVWKNGKDTGLRFYTTTMSPSSAGRVAPGRIDLDPGQFQIKAKLIANNLGAGNSEIVGVVFKFERPVQ